MSNIERFHQQFTHVEVSDIEYVDAIEYLSFVIYPDDLSNRERFIQAAYKAIVWQLRRLDDSSKKESNEIGSLILGVDWKDLDISKVEKTLAKAGRYFDKRIIAFHALEFAAQERKALSETIVSVSEYYKTRDGKPQAKEEYSENPLRRIFNPSRSVIPMTFGIYVSILKNSPEACFKSLLLEPSWVEPAIKASHKYINQVMQVTPSLQLKRKGTKVIFKPKETFFVKRSISPLM